MALGRSSTSADFGFFFFIRQRLYLILSVLVSFGSVLQNVLATGCVWLHTRVVAYTCSLSAWRWREEDCDPRHRSAVLYGSLNKE